MTLLALAPDTVFDDEAPDLTMTAPLDNGTEAPPKRGPGRPRKDGSTPPATAPKIGRAPRNPWPESVQVERHLTTLVEGASVLVSFVDKFDGEILAKGGPQIVHELVELAKTDKVLRKYLEISAAPGKYGPLTVSIIGVVLPIMIHHRIIPFPLPKSETDSE